MRKASLSSSNERSTSWNTRHILITVNKLCPFLTKFSCLSKSGKFCAISFTRLNSWFYCVGFIGVRNLFWNSFTLRLIQHTLMAIRIFYIMASGCLILMNSYNLIHTFSYNPLTPHWQLGLGIGIGLGWTFMLTFSLKIVCFILYIFIRNCLVKQLFSHEIKLNDAVLL